MVEIEPKEFWDDLKWGRKSTGYWETYKTIPDYQDENRKGWSYSLNAIVDTGAPFLLKMYGAVVE
jgi:hypothetical protein